MFGQPTAATTGTTGGFNFGAAATTSAATTTATSGFGAVGALGGTGGFSFGAPAASTAATTGTFGGLGAKSVRFDTTTTVTAPTLSSLLTATPASQTATLGGGLMFGASSTPATGLLAATATVPATAAVGFGFGAVPASSAPAASIGLFNTTPVVAGTTGLFGGMSSTGGSLLTSTAAAAMTFGGHAQPVGLGGLGGVDPKASAACGSAAGAAKACDAKALKETCIPPEILTTVDELTKHMKDQKGVRENIARMSSKPLFRIQEDAKNLRQQLLFVTSGLQRNATAIEKLKRETHQELKHAEIAVRTKETPPGLQYENTAPTEYFQRLAEEFETQMQLYRQQITETENHLASADQSSSLSPQDLSKLLSKLNEGFIALAAQLQVTHEAVKEQKDMYLNYRRTFLGDASNVFSARTQNSALSSLPPVPSTVGPTPFSHMSNSAAVAMAAALNQTQQVTGTGSFGLGRTLPAPTGASTLGTGSLFGQTAGSTGLSGSSFGFVNPQASSAIGSGLTLGGFGSSSAVSSPFGTTATVAPFGSLQTPSTTGFGAFALQKTPSGSKRGKNA